MKPVTDPNLISQLEGPKPVTDPNILAQLEGGSSNPSLMDVLNGPATMKDWARGRVNAVRSLGDVTTFENLGNDLTQPLQHVPELDHSKPFDIASSVTPSGKKAMDVAMSMMPISSMPKVTAKDMFSEQVPAQEAIKQAKLIEAGKLGYQVPRSTLNPNSLGVNIGERFGGKAAIRTVAENANQNVTNKAAQEVLAETPIGKAIGLPANAPIENDTIKAFKNAANQAYQSVRNIGTVTPGNEYYNALDDIASKYTSAGKSFPSLAKDDVKNLVQGLKVKNFDSASAMDQISLLRDEAAKSFRNGDKGIGLASREAAKALEDEIDRHLARIGAPGNAVSTFRDARKSLAVLHSITDALNEGSGNIEAPALGKMLQHGVPLEGKLKQVAEFANANRLISRPPSGSPASGGSLEPLAYSMYGHIASPTSIGGGFMAGGIPIIAKPIVRPLMITTPNAENMLGNMSSKKSQIMARLLASIKSNGD
jgi:hypothetical protein